MTKINEGWDEIIVATQYRVDTLFVDFHLTSQRKTIGCLSIDADKADIKPIDFDDIVSWIYYVEHEDLYGKPTTTTLQFFDMGAINTQLKTIRNHGRVLWNKLIQKGWRPPPCLVNFERNLSNIKVTK
jgi:hypothetical protein